VLQDNKGDIMIGIKNIETAVEPKKLNDEQVDKEIKRLKKIIKTNYDALKNGAHPRLQVAHLENIIINYNKVYALRKPSFSDKAVFNLVKVEYKTLCAVTRTKPMKFDEAKELQKV
jgi:hypothetical protein